MRQAWEGSRTKILIHPWDDKKLTPIGYDLSVGSVYVSYKARQKIHFSNGDKVLIHPGETVLIATEEYIGLPGNKTIGGLIESKVSQVSKGLSHVSTTLDTDWEGH